MAKKKTSKDAKTKHTKRGRKKNQQTVLCSMTLNEYKKADMVLISSLGEPAYNTYVSKVWWEANKDKTTKWKLHESQK